MILEGQPSPRRSATLPTLTKSWSVRRPCRLMPQLPCAAASEICRTSAHADDQTVLIWGRPIGYDAGARPSQDSLGPRRSYIDSERVAWEPGQELLVRPRAPEPGRAWMA